MIPFKHLGLFLQQHRIQKDLTQKAVSENLSNVHVQFVSNWERGLCAPPGHCMDDLIKLLKINKEKLVEVMLKDSKAEIEAKVYPKKKRG